ncbi:hypothetical protein A6D98_03035 [Aliivibrio fischeri]|uniref:hypothetical protein n=1 Tax=Aliivibrio fischeri TaxID=668 RepID=UPI00080EAD09|nr:hypothetical protein [Aliivibrio fischeri]OCH01506.1 hypothetical protein A6E10_18770 [Aliivibrio fischeri]OCH63292.1 hypothetical protein A6D98_03035 [Aliivibrio fischeri]
MKPIYIECEYTIISKNMTLNADIDAIFYKKIGGLDIELTVSYQKDNVIAKVHGAKLEEVHIEELSNLRRFDGDKLSKNCRQLISDVFFEVRGFTQQVLALLKYHLNHNDIQEQLFSIKSELWGVTKDNLLELPSQHCISLSGDSICPLRDDTRDLIQLSIDNQVKPLLAMRHLHRAKSERSAHHKWIDATIAAELAVKEVLSRARPDLEILLLDMPSPPLPKLYGKILKEYLGEETPYKRAIENGVQIRNKLVHRHDSPKIDMQKATDYVKDIERAIFHLLTLLYPSDQLIKQTYARAML